MTRLRGKASEVQAPSDQAKSLVYTPKDVEGLLGLSKNSVNALLRSGQLRSVRYGRKWLIPHSAVEEFLK